MSGGLICPDRKAIPQFVNDILIVPAEILAEHAGASFYFNPDTQTATIVSDSIITLTAGCYNIIVDGHTSEMKLAPQIINNTLMTEIYTLSAHLWYSLYWCSCTFCNRLFLHRPFQTRRLLVQERESYFANLFDLGATDMIFKKYQHAVLQFATIADTVAAYYRLKFMYEVYSVVADDIAYLDWIQPPWPRWIPLTLDLLKTDYSMYELFHMFEIAELMAAFGIRTLSQPAQSLTFREWLGYARAENPGARTYHEIIEYLYESGEFYSLQEAHEFLEQLMFPES